MGWSTVSKKTFARVTKGKFVNKQKGIEAFSFEGRITGIDVIDDEYKNQKIKKVRLDMIDEKTKEEVCIEFPLKGWFSWGFFSKVAQVDLARPITLGIMGSEQNEKISFCWMRQEGKGEDGKIKSDPKFPKPVGEPDDNGNMISSWRTVWPALKLVMEWMERKLKELAPVPKAEKAGPDKPVAAAYNPFQKEKESDLINPLVPTPDDDLPF